MKYTQGVNGAVYLCTQPDDGPLGLKGVSFREQNTLFLCLVDRASRYNSLLMTNLTHFFVSLFITPLYMFRASQCSSSGDLIVLISHLV